MLTTQQIMKQYKISRTTLWRLGKAGLLKPIEPSELLTHEHENQYYLEDIERAIAARRALRTNRRKVA